MNGPVRKVAVFFRSPMDIVRPAAGHKIPPDSHGNVHVRILHFRAHKAHPETPSPGAARPCDDEKSINQEAKLR